jgi:hypothetical protein
MNRTRLFVLLTVLLGWSASAFAQATHISTGSSLPATCTVGDIYANTGLTPGVYWCSATNTWTITGGGAVPAGLNGNVQINSNGNLGAYAGTTAASNQVMTGLDANGAATSAAVTNAMLAGSIQASKLVGTDIATVGTIGTGTWHGTLVGVTFGGTGLASGTSGGVLAFTASGVLASSGALTANLPVIGGGAGVVPTVGSVSGNTTKFMTESGSVTSGNCFKADASGNAVDFGSGCGGTASPGGADTNVQFNDSSSFGGSSGFIYNKTTHIATLTGTLTAAGFNNAYVTKTANYPVTATDGTIECLTNAFTVTLPTAVGIQGRIYTIKNLQTANTCTVATTSSQTIDGASTAGVANGALTVQSDNANWRSINALGIGIGAIAQGDIIYGSAANTVTTLTKDTNATRYLSNTGTTNNPAWAQVALATGVSGILPVANGGTGTSSTISLPLLYQWTAGNCQNTTASIAFDMPTTLGATATCQGAAAGGHAAMGTAKFVNTEVDEVQGHVKLPADWTGAVDMLLDWNAVSTASGNVVWQVKAGCAASNEAPSTISFNNTAFAAVANQTGATLRLNVSSKTGIDVTGCAAGETLWFIVYRDTSASGDTLDQDVQLIDAVVTLRRAIVIGG